MRDHAAIDAHKSSDRQRINAELHANAGLRVDDDTALDIEEPAATFRSERHHEPERKRRKTKRDRLAHWKTKAWKRRTARRLARIRTEQAVREAA